MRSMSKKERSTLDTFPQRFWYPDIRNPSPDLQSFREALAVLQRQVDELDELKASHYQEIVEHEEEIWNVVQSKVRLPVNRAILFV
jgi:hypothetical protein